MLISSIVALYLMPYSIHAPDLKISPAHSGSGTKRTILNNLHAGSLGCAPTPSQYFALAESSLISFQRFPSPSIGALGIGSYVPASISLRPRLSSLFLLDPNYAAN